MLAPSSFSPPWVIPIAEISLEGLVYMVFIFLWVIGQLLAGKKKRQRRTQEARPPEQEIGPAPRPMAPMNEELRELLETITGQKLEVPPQAPPPPPKPAPEVVAAERMRRRLERQRAREVQRQPAPPPIPTFSSAAEDVHAPEHTAPAVPLPRPPPPATTVAMQSIALAMPVTKMPTFHAGFMSAAGASIGGGTGVNLRRLRERTSIRDAILHQIVLSPPKALSR